MRGSLWVRRSLLWLVLLLVGCGGGGGGKKSSSGPGPIVDNFPTVVVDWPARIRGVTAPGAASTVTITIEGAGANNENATVVGTRVQDPAYAQTFTLPLIQSGQHTMAVKFYPGTDVQEAAVIASATLTVRVNEDGSIVRTNGQPLGTVTTSTKLTGVGIQTNQFVPILQDKALYAYGIKNDSIVALPSGSVTWSLVSTSSPDKLALTPGGVARGARLGWQDVKASVDGITSAPTLVKVGWQSYQIMNERADVFAACDGTGDLLWSVGTDGGLYQLTKSSLFRNPALASVGSASAIARSADSHYVYVPTVENVKRWNTLTATIDKTFALDSKNLTENPYAIAVDPTAPLRIAVSFKNPTDQYVVALFEDGVRKFSALVLTDQPARGLTFDETGRNLFAYTGDGKVISLAVGVNGLTETARATGSGFRSAAPYLQVVGGKVYTHNLDAYTSPNLGATTGPEKIGFGYGFLAERGITPRLYSAQVEAAGRANGIVIYQDSGAGFTPITGLDLPNDKFVGELISSDANGFVYMTTGATLIRVNVIASN